MDKKANCVYVTNISSKVDKEKLIDVFSKSGKVLNVDLDEKSGAAYVYYNH
jgi:RNA recognition motif-containing protein